MWEPSDSSNPTTLNNPNKIEDYNTVFQSEGLFMRNGLGYIFHDNFWFKLNETAKVSYEQSKFVAYSSNYLDTTLFALVRAVGASMGTSVAVALIVHSTQVNYIELRDHVTPFNETMQLVGVWSGETTSSLLGLYNLLVDQARVIGFLNTYLFLTAISFATLPLIFLLRTKRATSP